MKKLLKCTLISVVSLASSVVGLAQSSTNYSMDRITVAAVGSESSSSNFSTTVVIAQDSLEGASSFCNGGFVNSVGFWSVLGDLPVPVVLDVDKSPGEPESVELTWSGADDGFQVFSSTSPTDVLDPANLDVETSACVSSDTQAPDLIFYRVIPKP